MMLPKNVNKIIGDSNKTELDDTYVISVNENEKEMMYHIPDKEEKFNTQVEKIIRKSAEYRRYIGILKQEMNLTNCKFLKIVDISESRNASIEMHHYPLTLFDIVQCYRDKIKDDEGELESYHTFRIANDVMKMHYEGKVGLVPLSNTAHELAHNGDIFIPLNNKYVFGDYNSLIESVKLSDDIIHKMDAINKMTKMIENGDSELDLSMFEYKPVTIEMSSAEKPLKINIEESQMA